MLKKTALLTVCLCILSACGVTVIHSDGRVTHHKPIQSMINKAREYTPEAKKKKLNEQLCQATATNNIDAVKQLLAKGADVNAQIFARYAPLLENPYKTPLGCVALGKGNTDIARLLLDKGADIDAKDQKGDTALMIGAWSGKSELIQLLIKNGADVNVQNQYGMTALHQISTDGKHPAISPKGRIAAALLLIENGANIHLKDNVGNTALDYAIVFANTEMIQILQDKGVKFNPESLNKAKEYKEKSDKAIIDAVNNNNLAKVRELLLDGVDANARDKDGHTPLMLAVANGRHQIAPLLIMLGADVNAKDNNGFTPLMFAAGAVDEKMVRLLLQSGADANMKSNEGYNALDTMAYMTKKSVWTLGLLDETDAYKNIESMLTKQGAVATGKGDEKARNARKNSLTVQLVKSVAEAIAEGGKNTTYVRIDTPATGISANVCIKAPNGTEYGRSGKECSSGGTVISKKAGTYHYNVMFHNGYHNDLVWYKRAKYFGSCSGSFSTDGTEQSITLSFTRHSDNIVDCSRMDIYKH